MHKIHPSPKQSAHAGHKVRGSLYLFHPQYRSQVPGQLNIRTSQKILMVEPFGLLQVETGSGLADPIERERSNQVLHAHQLLIGTRIPSHQCQDVNHCLGIIATLPIPAGNLPAHRVLPLQRKHGETQPVAVPLAQLSVSFRLEQQGQMGKTRHGVFPPKSLVQHHMQRSRGKPFFPTDYVSDPHSVVIHDIGQVVGGHPVRFEQHFIVQQM